MSDKSKALATTKPVSLLTGSDAKEASDLKKSYRDAQQAGRRIMSFGLRVLEIKTLKLKHGQWGKWLKQHAPELCRVDPKTGELLEKESASVSSYTKMTSDVLEDMGFTAEKYFQQISNSQQLGICRDAKFLTAPDKKLTPEAAQLKKQICDRVDNKTAKQIRFAFSQVEEDEDGAPKVKRGRLKGSTGLTKEQREAAKRREEQERIEDLEVESDDTVQWLEKNCDDQNVGLISDKKVARLAEAVQYAHDYLTNLLKQRKGQ